MEPRENADIFGTEGQEVSERAAAVSRFVLAFGLFVVGLVCMGTGMSQHDTTGALWFVGGILAVTAAFALPLSLRES